MNHQGPDLDGIAQFLDVDKALLSGLAPELVERLEGKTRELAEERANAETATQRLLDLQLDKDSLEHQLRETQARTADAEAAQHALRKELQDDIQRLGPSAEEAARAHAQVADLQRQLEQTAGDKRALLDSLERRTQQVHDLSQDLDATARRAADLRTAKQQLETQTETSATELAKLRSSRTLLQYDLDGSKARVDRLSKDLQHSRGETLKAMADFEQQLETKIRALAASEATARGLQNANALLRSQNDDMATRLAAAQAQVQKLKVDADTKQATFAGEMDAHQRENELLNGDLKRAETLITGLKEQIAAQEDANARGTAELQQQLQQRTKEVTELKSKLDFVENELSDLPEHSTNSGANGSVFDIGDLSANGDASAILSPSASIMRELQRRGGSLVDLHQSYYKSKAEAGKWKRRYEALRRDMDGILQEIEINAPSLQAERQEFQKMGRELVEFSQRLEQATRKEEAAASKARSLEQKVRDQAVEHGLMARQVSDLSRQVQHLLINGQLTADGEPLLTSDEKTALAHVLQAGDDDAHGDDGVNQVISERMLLFKDIGELQEHNTMLLRACRSLSEKMERHEQQLHKQYDELETEAVAEAKTAIVALQTKLNAVSSQLDDVRKERDAFRALANDPAAAADAAADTAADSQVDRRELEAQQQQVRQLETHLAVARAQIADVKQDAQQQIVRATQLADTAAAARHELVAQLARAEARGDQADALKHAADTALQLARNDQASLQAEIGALKETLARQDERARVARDELLRTRTDVGRLHGEVAQAQVERQQWSLLQQSLNQQVFDATQEAARLSTALAELRAQSAGGSSSGAGSDQHMRLLEQAETLQLTVSQVSLRLGQAEDDLKLAQKRRETESAAHQQQVLQLTEKTGELQQQVLQAGHARDTLQRHVTELETQLAAADERTRSRERYMAGEIGETQHLREELEIAKQLSREAAVAMQKRETAFQQQEQQRAAAEKTAADQHAAQAAELQTAHEALAAVRAEAAALRTTLDNVSAQDLQATVDALRVRERELSQSLAELRAELESRQHALQAAEASLAEARQQSTAATSRAEALEATNTALTATADDLRAKHAALVADIEQRAHRQAAHQAGYEQQLEQLKSTVEELEATNSDLLLRVEALPSSGAPNSEAHTAVIAQLRRKLDLTADNLSAARDEALALTRRLAASEANAANLAAQIEQLSTPAAAAAAPAPAELAALQTENSELRGRVEAFNGRARELEDRAAQAQAQLTTLTASLQQAQHESESRQQQIGHLEADNQRWQARLAKQTAGSDAETRAAGLQEELDASKAMLGKLRSEAQEKLDKGRKERQELRDEVARLQQEVAAGRAQAQAAQAAQAAAQAADQQAEQRAKEAEERAQAAVKEAEQKAQTAVNDAEQRAKDAEQRVKEAEQRAQTAEQSVKEAQAQASAPDQAPDQAPAQAQTTATLAEITAKEKRIEDLETECNRLSDEILEAQSAVQAASALEGKLNAANAEIAQLREQVAGVDALQQQVAELKASASAPEAQPEKLAEAQQLQAKLEAENQQLKSQLAEADSFKVDGSALQADDAAAALRTELAAKTSPEQVDQFQARITEQVTGQVREQLKRRANEHVVRLVDKKLQDQKAELDAQLAARLQQQQDEFKQQRDALETAITRKFEVKQRLLKQKADKLEATNQELSLTVRKLKGGIDVDVVTSSTGVTKVVPTGPAQAERPKQGRAELQRPLVNRVGRAPKRHQEQGQQSNGNKKRRED